MADSTLATISVAGMLVGVTAKFNPFSSNDTSTSLRGRDDKLKTHLVLSTRGVWSTSGVLETEACFSYTSFRNLRCCRSFVAVNYSLGINSDLFKYFTGLVCHEARLHKRCIRGSSSLPTTTRCTHRLQIRHNS